MKPIKFKEANVTFAENQPEYLPLPAFRSADGLVITCWRLSWMERIKLLMTGRLWLLNLTFNQPLQPVMLQVKYPFETVKEGGDKVE